MSNVSTLQSNSEKVLPFIPFEEASVKLYTYACGCEAMRCLEKGDCTAHHSCKQCCGKTVFAHCGNHKGFPTGDHKFSWL